MKDLTVSSIDRQNILNNQLALETLKKYLGFEGMFFEGEYKFTTIQHSSFLWQIYHVIFLE